jgi:Amidase
MNASDATLPVLRPYLPATADFGAVRDSPRDFLERCLAALDAWEPRIGAFVTLNLAEARAAADRSTARWRAGNPLSPIDSMPLGIKDIIETADMPTQNGSPLFAGFRRAARGRWGDRGQDRDHGVRGDRAARHPQSLGSRPHARRLQQRVGGGGRRRGHSGRARHPSDRLDAASGELLWLLRLQADGRRAQPRRQL